MEHYSLQVHKTDKASFWFYTDDRRLMLDVLLKVLMEHDEARVQLHVKEGDGNHKDVAYSAPFVM